MSKRLPAWLPLAVFAVTLLVLFYPLLSGQVLFWGLPSLQFYPWREYSFDMLRAGQLPLWNPYNGAGAPLIANYQSALFYPLNWPGLILPLGLALSLTAVLHLFIAAWGMWAFTGRLGLPSLGRGVSALAFGLGSYLVARLGTYPMVAAAAWMPWVLWATLGILQWRRIRDAGLLALLSGLQLLAGHAQISWYSMLLLGLFSLFWILRHHSKDWWQRLGLIALGLLAGAMIAAIQLLPTAELLGTSQRSGGVDFDFAMNFSYGLPRVLNLLSPNFFGTPGDGTYLTKGAFFEDAVYIGLLPLVAAFAAVISWLRRRLRRDTHSPVFFATVPFWLMIVIIAFVFALGENSPVFPFLFRHVPTFSLFQAPVRWHIWTVLALSVLAGIGTQAWGRGHWLFFGTRLAVAAGIGAALLAIFVAPRVIPVPDNADVAKAIPVLINAVALTGLLGAGAGILTLLQPEGDDPFRPWWSLGVLIFVAADLAWAAQGLNPTVPAGFYDQLAGQPGDSRAYWPVPAEDHQAQVFETYLLFDDYRVAQQQWQAFRASQTPDLNLLDRQYLLNNFDPLQVGYFAQYLDLIEAQLPDADALLQAADTNALFDRSGQRIVLDFPVQRAWLVDSACWHADETGVVEEISSRDWDPYRQVHLIGQGDCPEAESSSAGRVTALQDNKNSLTVNLEDAPAGWLVLADTYYPGWTAAVDGQPAPVERANLAFRAVHIPAGAKTVRFDYRPGWLLPGALLSLAGLVIALALLRLGQQGDDK